MFKRILLLAAAFVMAISVAAQAQNPQTHDVSNPEPVWKSNAAWVNGIAPGYWPTAGSGLTLKLSAGTANNSGTIVQYAGGTLTMTDNSTNYVYLDPASSYAPASNTTGFTSSVVPIATVVTSGGAISTITDDRLAMVAAGGGPGGGVTSFSGDGALVTNSSSTGAVVLSLGTAGAHKWWGNNTSGTAAPGYQSLGTGDLPGSGASTVNGQTCTLGSSCDVNSGAAAHSVAINEGNGNAQAGAGPGATNTVLLGQTGADPIFAAVPNAALVNSSVTVNGTPCTLGSTCSVSTGGSGGGTSAFTATYANDGTTGTTLNRAAQLTTQTGSTARVCCTATQGNYFPAGSPFLGICTAGCGTTGSATITYAGIVGCVFENAVTVNHAIAVWSDGRCADVGFPPPASDSNSSQLIIGLAAASGSAGATVNVALGLVAPTRLYGSYAGFPSFMLQSPGSFFPQFAMPLLLNYPTIGGDPRAAGVLVNQLSCLQFLNAFNSFGDYSEITNGTSGCDYGGYSNTFSGSDLVLDPRTHNISTAALDINAAFKSFPNISNWAGNMSNLNLSQSNTYIWTLTANSYQGGTLNAKSRGQWFLMDICQDATGSRQYNFDPSMQGAGFVPAAANACTRQLFMMHDTNGTSNFSTPAVAPAIPIDITKTAQTASIASTAINAIKNNVGSAYPTDTNMARICGVIYTTTTGTGGTVGASISYTDTTGTAQTDTLISSVDLTTLGAHSGNCIVIGAKDSASISYSTTVSGASGSPQYMMKLSLEKLSSEVD